LPLFIQLPVLIALYWVFQKGIDIAHIKDLYSFMPVPTEISPFLFGIVNLAKPNMVLAVLAGAFQYWQAKLSIIKKPSEKKKDPGIAQMMEKQMLYFMPFFTILILFNMPSAIGLYWSVSTLFMICQQYIVNKEK
jgi:YidC/Oxa1 family membrane protein insertase